MARRQSQNGRRAIQWEECKAKMSEELYNERNAKPKWAKSYTMRGMQSQNERRAKQWEECKAKMSEELYNERNVHALMLIEMLRAWEMKRPKWVKRENKRNAHCKKKKSEEIDSGDCKKKKRAKSRERKCTKRMYMSWCLPRCCKRV